MEEKKIDNKKLDELADRFSGTQDNTVFAEFMKVLENSIVFVPAQVPPPDGTPPKICLLAKNDGSKVFPMFTSTAQIPDDKRPPALVSLPFSAVVKMIRNNPDGVTQVAVNPFTKGFVLTEKLLELVEKRYEVGANKAGAEIQGQNVQLTEQQFNAIAHVKMSREYLPKMLFADPDKVLSDIKLEKEKYILKAYKESYPAGAKVPYEADDIAVMSLQIEDDLIITRIDLPEKYTQEGSPLRIYITEHAGQTGYYLIEKGGPDYPSQIAQVDVDGNHIKLEEAPDNGAEIEAIMGLIRPS